MSKNHGNESRQALAILFLKLISAELVVRLLNHLGLNKPTHIPARIIYAIQHEKARGNKALVDLISKLRETSIGREAPQLFSNYISARAQRNYLIKLFPDVNALQKYYEARSAWQARVQSDRFC